MAEPTLEEKMAAANEALAVLGVTDVDEAKRTVAIFWSQVPLLPVAEPPEPDAASPVLVTALLNSEDPALKARIKALGEDAQELMKALMASSGGSP